MKNLLVWPTFILLLHALNIIFPMHLYKNGSLGFEAAGMGIIEILLILSLIVYIPLSITYAVIQGLRRRKVTIWTCFGLVMLSFPLGFYLARYFPILLHFADRIFLSRWWWLRF